MNQSSTHSLPETSKSAGTNPDADSERFDTSEVRALIAQYTPRQGPDLRLHDMSTIGFVISRSQSHPDPNENMPIVGQVLAEAPVIEEMSYRRVMLHLLDGSTVPMSPASVAKLRNQFQHDDRYTDRELIVSEASGDCTMVSLRRKAD